MTSFLFSYIFYFLSSMSSPVFPFAVIKLQKLTKKIALYHNYFVVRCSPEISNTVELNVNNFLILNPAAIIMGKMPLYKNAMFLNYNWDTQIKVYTRCPKTQLLLFLNPLDIFDPLDIFTWFSLTYRSIINFSQMIVRWETLVWKVYAEI